MHLNLYLCQADTLQRTKPTYGYDHFLVGILSSSSFLVQFDFFLSSSFFSFLVLKLMTKLEADLQRTDEFEWITAAGLNSSYYYGPVHPFRNKAQK